ncbi:DinB family protein [Flavimarina sp. Hel_I_48]|uniref:DinB family protein n=1 Tax=Flavimarina sp. Hel_I_48 TaxID=1392488 RepID=UPI0004DF43DC|nr:DinB family protein [Flavimarina sp. Hel_I_48]
MTRKELGANEFNPFYGTYIDQVDENLSLVEALTAGKKNTIKFLKKIPENKLKSAYAEGKWTILEVILHIIDTERIFNYRALCIARGDKTAFPGFEQDDYIAPSKANERSFESLLEEYEAVRNASMVLFKNLPPAALTAIGEASKSKLSARAAGFIMAGHEKHHCNIITERYL